MSFDWQLVAVVACVAWATSVIVRRARGLFRESSSNGCGSGGCSACPSNQTAEPDGQLRDGFVSLQTLVDSSHPTNGVPRP